MYRSNVPGPVPDRWMNCPRKANSLIIDKFMAFKTPLSERYDNVVPPACRFTPKMLFDFCKKKKIKFGLWIDLTNTTRFYDKTDIEEEECKYVKLECRGHGETPSEDQVKTFVSLVHRFISQHPLECIAVHCTHGFNRTGFLIVSYLVEKMDCSLERALDIFAIERSPGIYKEDYINELYRRYDKLEEPPPPPALPDWYFNEEPLSNDQINENNTASTSEPNKIQNDCQNGKIVKFMDGVPGVEWFRDYPQVTNLRMKVRSMCQWKGKGFPGSQPVSMGNNNIHFLKKHPYRVSWKADGMRYMMLINGVNDVYFFDRDFNVFRVEGLKFPCRKDLNAHIKDTLIDGEMVIDKVNDENIPRYLVYDIIKFDEEDISKFDFYPTRLQCIENEIIKPRYEAMQRSLINKNKEPFSVRKKDFWDITQAGSLLSDKFAKTLSHEPDGLIFQPSKEPYIPGKCDSVLKWKPLSLNSIDFRLKIAENRGVGIISTKVCQLYVGQLDQPFAKMKYKKALKDLNNKIIECKFENGEWKFMRERTDKSFPNSYETANAVWASIKNPITKEELLSFIEKCRLNDAKIMPPPPKRSR